MDDLRRPPRTLLGCSGKKLLVSGAVLNGDEMNLAGLPVQRYREFAVCFLIAVLLAKRGRYGLNSKFKASLGSVAR